MGCSPRAVQFSSLVWPFLAMVVLGWLVIMAGTEEAQTSVSVTNCVESYVVTRWGSGDVVLETEDIFQMYRHLYFCASFSIFISRLVPC